MTDKLSREVLENYLVSWKEWIFNLMKYHPRITKGSEWRKDDEQAHQQIIAILKNFDKECVKSYQAGYKEGLIDGERDE